MILAISRFQIMLAPFLVENSQRIMLGLGFPISQKDEGKFL